MAPRKKNVVKVSFGKFVYMCDIIVIGLSAKQRVGSEELETEVGRDVEA